MPTTPAGPLTIPRRLIHDLLAGLSEFSTWAGADPASKVFAYESPITLPDRFAILGWDNGLTRQVYSQDHSHQPEQVGNLVLVFRNLVDANALGNDAFDDHENHIGGIIAALEIAAVDPLDSIGYLWMDISKASGPARVSLDDRDRTDAIESAWLISLEGRP